MRGTGSVLSRTALWDYIGDAVALFIGFYEVALETGSNFVVQNRNRPTVQFETTSTQSHAFSTPVLPGFGIISLLHMCRRVLGRDWVSHAASTFSIGIQMERGILLTSYNHPKASKQCASDIISALNQLLVVRVSMRPWLLIFTHIIEHSFLRKWTLRSVYERKEN